MKSLTVTAILSAFVAYAGSFLTVWTLPHQQDPYTIKDLKPGVEKIFHFTKDLRSARSENVRLNASLFTESSFDSAGDY